MNETHHTFKIIEKIFIFFKGSHNNGKDANPELLKKRITSYLD